MNITKDEALLREQTRLTKAKADLAEVKLKLQKGELVRKADAVRQWKENASKVRAKMLSLPELAPQFEGLSAGEVRALLGAKVREILNELAEEYR